MKGIVLNMLNEMVEERFGMDTWDALIESTQPASRGIYTSVELYPDSELLNYVAALSESSGIEAGMLVHAFGHYMIGRFHQIHPGFFAEHDAKSFLKSVHDIIHVEVRKLHPDVILPEFEYEDESPDSLVMLYKSPRHLCQLAEGLIDGAVEHFGAQIERAHPVCMHNGADHCRIEMRFKRH